jgi:hypothetical protein
VNSSTLLPRGLTGKSNQLYVETSRGALRVHPEFLSLSKKRFQWFLTFKPLKFCSQFGADSTGGEVTRERFLKIFMNAARQKININSEHWFWVACHEFGKTGCGHLHVLVSSEGQKRGSERFNSLSQQVWEKYDLSLISVNNAGDLPKKGDSVIIAAMVGAKLQIRIFDADGKKVIDKPEVDLAKGKELSDLKGFLEANPFPDASTMSAEEVATIKEKATSVSGHTHYVIWEEALQIAKSKTLAGTLSTDFSQVKASIEDQKRVTAYLCKVEKGKDEKKFPTVDWARP